jgi:hypothetical protein
MIGTATSTHEMGKGQALYVRLLRNLNEGDRRDDDTTARTTRDWQHSSDIRPNDLFRLNANVRPV